MIDYSLESAFERIDNFQTKQYFQEVLSSYHGENYRSAVVMLWSVIICDLIYKLQLLRDVDSDSVAQDILSDVENKQRSNPNSPDWELHLLKIVKDKTELLDTSDFTNLNSIQQIRHLSAHPVLNNTDLLFTPHKEQVRSFLRIALDAVLTKPPVFLKKVVDEFVEDLASKKNILLDDPSLKRYIESKYFRRLRPNTENHLFRALWKFVFRLENEDTNENRDINYRCIEILYRRRPDELRKIIQENQETFGNLGGEVSLSYLILFLSNHPQIYENLSESARVIVENYSNSNLNNFSISFFISESINKHFEKIIEKMREFDFLDVDAISTESWKRMTSIAFENQCSSLLKKIAIYAYIHSTNFNTADVFFSKFIEPLLDQFTADEVIELIEGISINSQVYARKRAWFDHRKLWDICKDILPVDFDGTKYSTFFKFDKTLFPQPVATYDDDIPF